jgi:hypothetical protein
VYLKIWRDKKRGLFDWSGLIRGLSFDRSGLIRGRLLYTVFVSDDHNNAHNLGAYTTVMIKNVFDGHICSTL